MLGWAGVTIFPATKRKNPNIEKMSEKEKQPGKNLPAEHEHDGGKLTNEERDDLRPAEDLVERPAEVEEDEADGIGDAMLDEAQAAEINRQKSEEEQNSPEAAIEDKPQEHPQPEGEANDMAEVQSASAEDPIRSEEESSASTNQEGGQEEDKEDVEEASPTPRKNAQEELDDAVAEDSEDESAGERHGIPKKDYHAMTKEALVDELERLVKNEKVQTIKDHVEEIRAEFSAKFDEEVEQKKEDFLADGGNIIDFHYSTPLKKRFNSVYFDYKEKRNRYYQQLKQDLNQNLQKRLEIIEELKSLIDVEENINTTYKHFKDLQDRWRTAGAIPRDKYNTVWNTYHHHVENFYDFLHLNREFRDLDFKHNLEQKLKIITRAEELTQEPDINRAFRELQMLHKMWKEDLGPVERTYREDIWKKFSEATKKIHDRRQEYFEQLEKDFEKNLEKKKAIIEKLREISQSRYDNHRTWQQKIREVEALREEFFKAGKVPRSQSDQTWKEFKEAVRTFNRNKNSFYKNQKKEQYENLEKKLELVRIAEENKDSDDFSETTPLMKKIQSDWKKIGHVPRKDSDKIWKRFKAACNHYFDRVHSSRREENQEELQAFEKKRDLLDRLRTLEITNDREKDLAAIKDFLEQWKQTGRVPYNKRYIEGKFNKALDQAFDQLDLDRKEAEMLKYENKVQALEEEDDTRKIHNEHYFLTKKIEETTSEIRQLENNLQFFSNADQDNPLVQEVHRNIQQHREQLKIWKEKLEKVKSLY